MMSKRTTDVAAYLSWIGLLVAFVMGDRAASRFHLNQSLTIWLAGTVAGIAGRLLGWLPLVGWAADLAVGLMLVLCVVCWFIGIINAISGVERPVPLLGHVRLI